MIKRILTYSFIITLCLYGFRYIHYKGLLKQNQGYYAKYKTAFLESNNFDVIFLGSSRVQMHYNTYLFDSLTHSNSFNLSMAGASPKIAYYALKVYLKKSKTPKELFYEVDYHNLDNESHEIKDFNNYFPFLKDENFRKEFSKVDSRMQLFYLLPYYSLPFTGFKNLSTSLHGWLHVQNRTDSLFYKGYFKENLRPSLNLVMAKPKHIAINKNEQNYMDSIISLCKTNRIQISLITSPIFGGGKIDVTNKTELIDQLKTYAAKHKVAYLDLSSLSFCNQRQLFVDHFHMNYKGACLFTTQFAGYYSNNLQKKALEQSVFSEK